MQGQQHHTNMRSTHLSDTVRQLLMVQAHALWLVQGHQGFVKKALRNETQVN